MTNKKCEEHDLYFGRAHHENYTKWIDDQLLDKVKWSVRHSIKKGLLE